MTNYDFEGDEDDFGFIRVFCLDVLALAFFLVVLAALAAIPVALAVGAWAITLSIWRTLP